MMGGRLFLMLLVFLSWRVSFSLEKDESVERLSRIVFVLMSQEHHGEASSRTERALLDSLSQAGLPPESAHLILTGREASWHGSWTFFPLFPFLTEEFKGDLDWFIFLNENARIHPEALLRVLKPYSPDESVFIGHELVDGDHTVIHHYDPPGFKYPAFGSGLGLSFKLVEELSRRISTYGLKSGKFPSTFSIDPLYELANVIHYSHEDNLAEDPLGTPPHEGPFLTHTPHFCLGLYSKEEDTSSCAIISLPNPVSNALCRQNHGVLPRDVGKAAPNILYASEKEDPSIPTVALPGIINTPQGHCQKTSSIIEHFNRNTTFDWLVIADDDTLLSVHKIGEILSCYDPSRLISLGQRYGFRVATGEYGYDYITGGGGMIFSRAATLKMFSSPEFCACPKADYPDDMHLGSCMSNIGSPGRMSSNGGPSSGRAAAAAPPTTPGAPEEEVSEFVVRIPPRNARKSHHVMKFNASLNIDFTKWAQGTVRMVRENNQKATKGGAGFADAEVPKYGAGSEFGREQKEEARRKKYGFNKKKYKPEDQPWLIRVGDKKTGKRYRGIREGGVAENTTYYVFTHAQDGAFEAHPISDWYNFTPILTYKTLNAEEAEEKFAERGKILNHWALMISDMDEWVEGGDELETDSDDEEKKKKDDSDDEGKNNSKKKGKDAKNKKKKRSKEDVQNEAFEDSDDGDDECREVDYMSDESSDSETEVMEKNDTKGVDQDHGLARMLESESSSEDENDPNKKKSDKEDEAGEEANEDEGGASKKEKNKKKKDKKGKLSKDGGKQSTNSSRSSSPAPDKASKAAAAADKRKALIDNILDPGIEPAQKKSRLETFGSSASSLAALEEDVRRYLTRKPMTTTELVKKIHSKRFQDISSEELMPLLVNVLKKVNPHTSKTKGIMYLSLKPDK
ncbi:Beta 1_3galactosyltransferaselike [Caligus rogercresseyi]|uniref:General transcription factor IIF subunit 1 n=1 Tax=Caligus rogercresseyi TaxID=217165 RepID=A0A7T8KHW6_CALRO|nr:Beta 1_3galactosyltransferaselike [Caligus rogercresseyi]